MFCWAGRVAACCKSGTNTGPQACRIWWMRYPFRLLPPQDNQRGPPWPPSPPVAFMAIPWGGGPALVAAPPLYTSPCCPSAHCPRESGWRPCPCGGPAPVSQVLSASRPSLLPRMDAVPNPPIQGSCLSWHVPTQEATVPNPSLFGRRYPTRPQITRCGSGAWVSTSAAVRLPPHELHAGDAPPGLCRCVGPWYILGQGGSPSARQA